MSKFLFILGVIVDVLSLILSLTNLWMLNHSGISSDLPDSNNDSTGLTAYGQFMRWGIPAGLMLVIMIAFWMKSRGHQWLANIILWIPALPVFVGLLIWGFLAFVFVVFSKQ
jgi:hypothetical protein